jgi:hypothetical protein
MGFGIVAATTKSGGNSAAALDAAVWALIQKYAE